MCLNEALTIKKFLWKKKKKAQQTLYMILFRFLVTAQFSSHECNNEQEANYAFTNLWLRIVLRTRSGQLHPHPDGDVLLLCCASQSTDELQPLTLSFSLIILLSDNPPTR